MPRLYLYTGGGNSNVKRCVRTGFFLRNRLSITHEVARNLAISLRTSMSLRIVSPNPGVSIKVTRQPSRSKGSATCTVLVPGPKLAPLTRLINCANHGQAGGEFAMSFFWQYTAVGWKRVNGEIAYRGFSTFYRTHDAIRPSGLTDRRRLVGSQRFVWDHGT